MATCDTTRPTADTAQHVALAREALASAQDAHLFDLILQLQAHGDVELRNHRDPRRRFAHLRSDDNIAPCQRLKSSETVVQGREWSGCTR
jgi:hypothetical protein